MAATEEQYRITPKKIGKKPIIDENSVVEDDTTIFRETSLTFSNIKSISDHSEQNCRNASPGDFLSSKKFDFERIVTEAKNKIRR